MTVFGRNNESMNGAQSRVLDPGRKRNVFQQDRDLYSTQCNTSFLITAKTMVIT
jgi:hypothetical protein